MVTSFRRLPDTHEVNNKQAAILLRNPPLYIIAQVGKVHHRYFVDRIQVGSKLRSNVNPSKMGLQWLSGLQCLLKFLLVKRFYNAYPVWIRPDPQ